MEQQYTLKMNLLSQIYDKFVSSDDFNGLSMNNLHCSLDEDSMQSLIELIQEGDVQLISQLHDTNPYIIRFGFASIEEQIESLKEYNGCETICFYPSSSFLKKNRNISEYELKPFEKMMALGYPQLQSCYFKYDILSNYAPDPRMNFKFESYSGSIISNESVDAKNSINLKTFGIGRQDDDIIIVAFPRYLRNMSTSNQFLWNSYRIIDTNNCKILKNYQDNQFGCNWSFPNTVYRSILKEIYNINELTEITFSNKLFKKEYTKDELFNFDMLAFPSLDYYNQFLLLLEKVIISNIDINFFKPILNVIDEEGKQKGTLNCLKEWITKVNKDVVKDIHSPLYNVRKERQAPAHKIEGNKYSNDYLIEQHNICREVYYGLNLLRRLLQTHPKTKDFSIKYPDTKFIEI
jgi:hypothetical protein